MEHPRIDDDRVVDRYLAGRLPAEDEALFEEHLFECADCLEKVEWGEELRRGLRAVAAEDAAPVTVSLGLMAWLKSRGPMQLAGLALAFVVLPALLLWQQIELSRVRAAAQQAAVGFAEPMGDFLVVSLGMVRAAGDAVEIRPEGAPQFERLVQARQGLLAGALRFLGIETTSVGHGLFGAQPQLVLGGGVGQLVEADREASVRDSLLLAAHLDAVKAGGRGRQEERLRSFPSLGGVDGEKCLPLRVRHLYHHIDAELLDADAPVLPGLELDVEEIGPTGPQRPLDCRVGYEK